MESSPRLQSRAQCAAGLYTGAWHVPEKGAAFVPRLLLAPFLHVGAQTYAEQAPTTGNLAPAANSGTIGLPKDGLMFEKLGQEMEISSY